MSTLPEEKGAAHAPAKVGWNRDLPSKLLDGLLPALVIYLLIWQIVLPIKLIHDMAGEPGLLVYNFGLLAVGMFGLQRALEPRLAETSRAWYGITAGILGWSVIQISLMPSDAARAGAPGIVSFLLVSLTVTLFWRKHLTSGGQFAFGVFLGNWSGSLFLTYFQIVSTWNPMLQLLYRMLGYNLAVLALGTMIWIFAFSTRRIQRIWASLLVVFCTAGAIFILHGSLF